MVIQAAPVRLRDFKNELLGLSLKVQSKNIQSHKFIGS